MNRQSQRRINRNRSEFSEAVKKQLTYRVDARPIHLKNSGYYTAIFSPKITTTARRACQDLTGNDGSSSSNSTHFLYVATLWALVTPKKTENSAPDAGCTFSRSMDRLASQPESPQQYTYSGKHFQNKV